MSHCKWESDFILHAQSKGLIMLNGQIWDFCINRNREFCSLDQRLQELLLEANFKNILIWDNIDGADHPDLLKSYLNPTRPSQAQTYAISMAPSPRPEPEATRPDLAEFVRAFARAVQQHTKQSPATAFVLDWSRFLFGQQNHPDKNDLLVLGSLAKSLRSAMKQSQQSGSQILLVVICPQAKDFPNLLWTNNPLAQLIHLGTPDISSRKQALQILKHDFALAQDSHFQLESMAQHTEGLSMVQLQQLAKISQLPHYQDKLSFGALLRLHQYGQQESPWEKIDAGVINQAEQYLGKSVKGQGKAIQRAATILGRAWTGMAGAAHSHSTQQPKGVLFLAGPTGVGKTELAKAIARLLFGDEQAMLRFDMSEYNQEHSAERLVGAPPGFIGYDAGGQLTNAVRAKPFSVLLFDEIEKAHPRVLDKFLQILEDGRLTDGQGNTTYFGETLIVFTSNIGAADATIAYKRQMQDPETFAEQSIHQLFIDKVKDHFKLPRSQNGLERPELLNRIGLDNIVPFDFLRDEDIDQITLLKLGPIKQRLKEKWNIQNLEFQEQHLDRFLKLIRNAVSLEDGGRGVVNTLNTQLIDQLANFLTSSVKDPKKGIGKSIHIKVVYQDEMEFSLK